MPMPRPFRSLALSTGLFAVLSAGCRATVGTTCSPEDLVRAREVVYAPDGSPAYAGQALIAASCGGSAVCHTSSDGARRFGAPADLVFDVGLVEGPDEDAEQTRLREAVLSLYRHRDAVYTSVVQGTMPPAGRGEVPDLREAASMYRRFAGPDDEVGVPLPTVQSPEGREILRNWLACGVPVVERSSAPSVLHPCVADADCPISGVCDTASGECAPVGDVVDCRVGVGLLPTWSSIHGEVIAPSCAVPGCHVGPTAFNGLDFADEARAYELLASGSTTLGECGGRLLTPGDADASYVFAKMEGALPSSCGSRMPPTGLCRSTLEVIRTWIEAGAPR
ncbi:MAG: hypothetical protein OHK0013_14830 [Sandaracinaceae bacterium]